MAIRAKDSIPVEKDLILLFDSLYLFPSVLSKVVVEYWTRFMVRYEPKAFRSWELPNGGQPRGLASTSEEDDDIYVCDFIKGSLLLYTPYMESMLPSKEQQLKYPWALDIFDNRIYVADKLNISIFNLQKELISSFPLPYATGGGRGLKVSNKIIYLTIQNQNQIFVLTITKQGYLMNKLGSSFRSKRIGEFNEPHGLDVHQYAIFVCDSRNHRVQILGKDNGMYLSHWGLEGNHEGQFCFPLTVYLNEGVAYVGDTTSVQLFTYEGIFLQRLGGINNNSINNDNNSNNGPFRCVFGLLVKKKCLYICDTLNQRIKAFRRQ